MFGYGFLYRNNHNTTSMTTSNYQFVELPGNASERVTINANFQALDGLLSLVVTADVNLTTFPASPVAGRTILLAVGTGPAIGLDGSLAVYTGSVWRVVPPSANLGPVATQTGFVVPNATLNGWVTYQSVPVATIASPRSPSVSNSTLTGNLNLLDTSATYQIIDPGGANRVVTLPATTLGKFVEIRVTGNTTFTVTVQNQSASTLAVLTDQVGSSYKAEFASTASEWVVTEVTRP